MKDDTFQLFFIFVACFVVATAAYDAGKRSIIKELCSQNKYDFCEVDEIVYKMKGKTNDKSRTDM